MAPWILKILGKVIFKAIKRKIDLKKIDRYVNMPNELDVQMKQVQKAVAKYGQYIEEMEKDIAEIKAVAHKPIDGLTDRLKKLEKKLKLFK